MDTRTLLDQLPDPLLARSQRIEKILGELVALGIPVNELRLRTCNLPVNGYDEIWHGGKFLLRVDHPKVVLEGQENG
jgi:hypothetical protein